MSSPITVQMPMPNHWELPAATKSNQLTTFLSNILRYLFKLLCFLAVGDSSLEALWVSSSLEDLWTKRKEQYIGLLSNITVVAGLILTTTAVFLTTSPPTPEYIKYDDFHAYALVYLSFITAICSIFSGAIGLLIASGLGATAEVFRKLTPTPLHLCTVLALIACPFITFFLSGAFFSFFVLLACYKSTNTVLKILTTLVVIVQTSLFIPLICLAISVKLDNEKQHRQEQAQDQSMDNEEKCLPLARRSQDDDKN